MVIKLTCLQNHCHGAGASLRKQARCSDDAPICGFRRAAAAEPKPASQSSGLDASGRCLEEAMALMWRAWAGAGAGLGLADACQGNLADWRLSALVGASEGWLACAITGVLVLDERW